MENEKICRALWEMARKNGVSLKTLIEEMEAAIAAGMAMRDPMAQAFWRSVPRAGEVPTPVELIAHLSRMECQKPA